MLIAGTSSNVGKSAIVTGICRSLAKRGVKVAPFKAQNMSLNSFVTPDLAEIGRAQAVQAQAARITPEAIMNPVLIKPGNQIANHLIVLGQAINEDDEARFRSPAALLEIVTDSFRVLESRFDVVICEGAGSIAEINLRDSDIVNLGFAQAAGEMPVLLVGDIDLGGVLASLIGTLGVLSHKDQALIAGFIINKFRGNPTLFSQGLAMLEARTGRPTFALLPYIDGIGIDAEDTPDKVLLHTSPPPLGNDVLRIYVVALPHMSNYTDLDALACEPGVILRFADHPSGLRDADLIVLPGTRETVSDLIWLRKRHIDTEITKHAAAGKPVLGICGGFQMLGETIYDRVESQVGTIAGLSLLPLSTTFDPQKTLSRPSRSLADGTIITGYEIHHGKVERRGGDPLVSNIGCRMGSVAGTTWHGLFENDVFRRTYLEQIAELCNRDFTVSTDTRFEDLREAMIDRLGDLIDEHLDHAAFFRLLEGTPTPLPSLSLTLEHF